jgi:hypothetical protein
MSDSTPDDPLSLLYTRWTRGDLLTELLPHPEDEQRALLQVVVRWLEPDLRTNEPEQLAQALRWLLRLNADVLAEQAEVVLINNDDELLLTTEVSMKVNAAQLDAMAQALLDRAQALAGLWDQLLALKQPAGQDLAALSIIRA